MNKGIVNTLIFVAGAAAGSVATFFITKSKIQKSADEKFEEAIAEYKNAYNRNSSKAEVKSESKREEAMTKAVAVNKTDNDIHKEVASRYAYDGSSTDYTKFANQDEAPSEEYPVHERPYIISPDEFGEDYDTESFIYYADQVVADDNDNIIDEVEDTIGFESLNHIGEYETGCIHVRNDVLKKDYEVLQSLRRYSEVAAQRGIRTEE